MFGNTGRGNDARALLEVLVVEKSMEAIGLTCFDRGIENALVEIIISDIGTCLCTWRRYSRSITF